MHESRPIIALDFATFDEVKTFLAKFPKDEKLYVKIGMELFYATGPQVVEYVKSLGHSVFLDLKLHDIPNTVKSTVKVLAKLDVDIIDLHAAGGLEMMKAARQGLLESGKDTTKLIAVTQLTSTSEEMMHRDQGIMTTLPESVINYAKHAQEAGLDGVVCSGKEVALIKKAIKSLTRQDFICLTPGIRPLGAAVSDQKRVMTPAEARKIGSDYIVVGRPITKAAAPVEAYGRIYADWNQ